MVKRSRPTFRQILQACTARCSNCETTKDLTINHKKPLSQGGTNDPKNLEILCEKCHRQFHGLDKSKKSLR